MFTVTNDKNNKNKKNKTESVLNTVGQRVSSENLISNFHNGEITNLECDNILKNPFGANFSLTLCHTQAQDNYVYDVSPKISQIQGGTHTSFDVYDNKKNENKLDVKSVFSFSENTAKGFNFSHGTTYRGHAKNFSENIIGKKDYSCSIQEKNEKNSNFSSRENNFFVKNINETEEVLEHSCGPLTNICNYCNGLHFIDEANVEGNYKNCCHFGKVKLQTRPAYPNYLKNIFTNNNFKKNIRSYNSALSFASMGAQIENIVNGPYTFKIHGQIYHSTYNLNSANNEVKKYSQLYVLDTSEACNLRLQNPANSQCDKSIMENIDKLIREINPYAKAYKNMNEVELEEKQNGNFKGNVSMVFNGNISRNINRYNMPTSNEIAMVFTDPNGEPPFKRDVKVYAKGQQFDNVNLSLLSPHLDPMTYVLFYPHGESGWQPNLFLNSYHNTMHKVSMLQYKIAQITIRENEFNPILNGGKLFQQWVTDSYLQVEANNLNFIRQNQKRLRIEQYKGLIDHFNSESTNTLGRPIILPSTFQGSPRNMRERYHDAMAIVTKYGKPDLFITMTCNPNWSEIKDNLYPGQQPCDRPDLVARVFKIKLNALLKDINKNKIFGEVAAHVYTIEFQKRGLPHAHILIILKKKIDTVEKIDKVVSAEIPKINENEKLHKLVLKHMIHGPCGHNNPTSVCMENNKCTKEFPKEFSNRTKITDGYPIYKRRQTPNTPYKNTYINNSHVVPYNKFLLQKYNCHINVEVCTSVKSVKYIFKYIYKGYDCASIQLYNNNEIDQYINTRYIAAPEAMWRLLEFRMHDKSHKIIRLPVHLPREQMIIYEEGSERNLILNESLQNTQLLAWFKLNQVDVEARNYLYSEIPLHYVYTNGEWKKRQRGQSKVITRLYTVSPSEKERFYLRILLLNVKGAMSFEDLKTVNGVIYNTFEESARNRNLLINDNEWNNVMDEAISTQSPSVLRQLFAFICIFNKPNNPLELFNTYLEDLSEDIKSTNMTFGTDDIKNEVLLKLKPIFDSHNQSMSNYNLPEPIEINNDIIESPIDVVEVQNGINKLNNEQKTAFDIIISNLDSNGRLLFLDGPAGSGKTFLYKVLLDYIKSIGKIALPFATTGIAADLINNAKTVHSGFKLPVPLNENSLSRMKETSPEANILKESSLILIDEVSMLSKYGLEAIEELLRRIMKNNKSFGGKTILLGGDLRQTTNVVMRGTRNDIVETSIINSKLWSEVHVLKLSENMRSYKEKEFSEWLLKIGNGSLNDIDDMVNIPSEFIEKNNIVNAIFKEEFYNHLDENNYSKVILTSKNEDAIKINNEIINKLYGEEKVYVSIDTIVSEDKNDFINYPMEFINKQQPSGMPPHKLTLKIGAIVMLLRNLNQSNGLLNGTRMVILEMHNNYLLCKTITGIKKGKIVAIPRIDLAPSETSLPFILKRRQFPVIPAFAMTIHKSQGQSFDSVGIYLQEPLFAHGQLYVALSRIKNPKNLKVFLPPENNGRTKNVVYKELL